MTDKDDIFQQTKYPEDFVFDEKVVKVFDDMVSRSVPFYNEIQTLQTQLVLDFVSEPSSVVCDLGCSTGTTIDLILKNPLCNDSVQFIGYDNSNPMLNKARNKLSDGVKNKRVELINADLNALPELPPCHVVLMNWTLQFVRPIDRENLLRNVFNALKPGGALFISEKILGSSPQLNRQYIDHYLQFKKSRGGYSNEENQRKREALENVLVPYRLDENYRLLNRCGFEQVDTYFRWLNFACIIAVKTE
ncbi:MAG: carboxy-S-adenosyl-L-methionine synthase CmoA [Methylococcaceae bacterium]|nr:carboxy-S-adenosyl-L-methionine synthase CmoA [Methylococcaceae bacterium]